MGGQDCQVYLVLFLLKHCAQRHYKWHLEKKKRKLQQKRLLKSVCVRSNMLHVEQAPELILQLGAPPELSLQAGAPEVKSDIWSLGNRQRHLFKS
jgi:hypothetical protein